MSVGKRREERTRIYEQSAMILTLLDSPLTEAAVAEFVRCGVFIQASKRLDLSPELERQVAAKLQEIERTGRLIVEC